MSGLARWNAARAAESVADGKGRKYLHHSSALVDRVNTRCRKFFGEEHVPEVNFRRPMPPGNRTFI